MKKIFSFLLLLCLTGVLAVAGAEAARTDSAEVSVTWKANSKKVSSDLLTDGSDDTFYKYAAAKTATLTATLPEGETVQSVYLRIGSLADEVELQTVNAKKKWVTVSSMTGPVAECVLTADEPLDRVRVRITYKTKKVTQVMELRAFSGAPEESLHAWQPAAPCDILLTLDAAADLDGAAVAAWTAQGRSVAVASLTVPSEPLPFLDALWDAGVRSLPMIGKAAETTKTPEAALKKMGQKTTTAVVASWIRQAEPLLLVDAGKITALVMQDACANALDADYEVGDAAANGIWSVPVTATLQEEALPLLAALPERTDSLLREACLTPFASAEHSDPATIPYPANRDEEGYLTAGEFAHEDPENGLWAYLSPTVQVEIIQYDVTERPRQRIFVAEVKFKPDQEQFRQHIWVNGDFPTHCIYPQTLAQTSKLVIAINGDYYLYRVNKKALIGNVLRDGKVLYNMKMNKSSAWPTLETLALHDDGTMSVYGDKEVTAQQLADQGGIHDALSFGPYTARDGELRVYDGKYCEQREPRTALGMIGPGHYIIVNCEGRIPNNGPKGMTINEVGMLLYGKGCTEAFLMDGGNTSVLTFLGRQLNRSGLDTYIGSPRNQHELFGVGTTELVHTDWAKGNPNK